MVVYVRQSVYPSGKSHLTSGASIHPENTDSVGNRGQKTCVFFNRSVQELWCETQAKELIISTEKLNTITLAKKQTDYHIKRFGSYTATIISEI